MTYAHLSIDRLVHLNICDNRVSSLPESITGFAHLHTLYLRNNCIDSTVMLDRLQLLPALNSLSFQGNPLVHGLGTDQSRTLVIARLGCIRKLNGSLVTSTASPADVYDNLTDFVGGQRGAR